MFDIEINVYSHHFTVKTHSRRAEDYVRRELEALVLYNTVKQRGRFVKVPQCVFARRTKQLGLRGFVIEQYQTFLDGLSRAGIPKDRISITNNPPKPGKAVVFKKPPLTPNDEQVDIIEVVKDAPRSAITMRPGAGKTFTSLYIAYLFGKVFAIVTLGGYAAQWVQECKRLLYLENDEILVIRGVDKLNKAIKQKKEGKLNKVKVFFFSTGTIRSYIKAYEKGDPAEFVHSDVPPQSLLEFFEVGLRITDEVHKEIHANYIFDLYCNVEKTIGLTGTLYAKDPFKVKIYEYLLPNRIRLKGRQLDPYRELIDVWYRFEDPDKIKFIGPQGMYSHVAFEQSIIKQPEVLKRWQKFLYKYIESKWLLERTETEKMILWFATIQMCEIMTEYFKHRVPDLIINKYNSDDPYEIIHTSDVIISTRQKSGVAIDIPDLTQAHDTTQTDSQNMIVQSFGRLRQLKGDLKDVVPKYYSYVCSDSQAHHRYLKTRKDILKDQIKDYYTDYLQGPI